MQSHNNHSHDMRNPQPLSNPILYSFNAWDQIPPAVQTHSQPAIRLILDSNFLMNRQRCILFAKLLPMLKQRGMKVLVPEDQRREIVQIKERHPYKDPASHSARCALARLEQLQEQRLMSVVRRNPRNPPRHVDEVVMRLVHREIREQCPLWVVTEDRDLRMKIREMLDEKTIPESLIRVMNTHDLARTLGLPIELDMFLRRKSPPARSNHRWQTG